MIIRKTNKAGSASIRSPDVLTLGSTAGWEIGQGSSESAALRVTAMYRAIDYRASTIALMPYYLMDRKSRVRLEEHKLRHVLTVRANELMSPSEYRYYMESRCDITGNAYAYIGRNSRTGYVEELLPLMPELVDLKLDERRQLHYLYTDPISGQGYDLAPSQVIHYRNFTRDGIRGMSLIALARDVIAKDRSAKSYERALYNNGGRPSGVLYTDADLGAKKVTVTKADGTTEEISKKEQVRRAWERVHSGGDNAFRTAVLDLGLKYQPIAMNNSDAQFVESNDITVADIARISGVPLHALMSGKQSYESNSQNRIEFVQTTALAIVTRREDEDSYKLLRSDERDKLRVRRNMDAALRGDTESRAAFYKTMREIGAYSVNDILALEDLPDVPGGNSRQASLNYVPLELFNQLSLQRNGGKQNENQ